MTPASKKVYNTPMFTEICGKRFAVVYREPTGRSDDNMGMSDVKDCLITVDKELNREMRESTLIHEFIHCVLGMAAIEHNEILVSVLENELYRQGFRVKVK